MKERNMNTTTRINNVSFVRPQNSTLSIDSNDVSTLLEKYGDILPEFCFLRELEDKIASTTKQKVKCRCGTQSYGNAKFCRECGTRLPPKAAPGLELNCVWWHDEEDDGYSEPTAANTFFSIFIKKVVPCLRGRAELSVAYSANVDDAEIGTAHFVIEDGALAWCEVQLHPGAEAPIFDAVDPYYDEDEEESDE